MRTAFAPALLALALTLPADAPAQTLPAPAFDLPKWQSTERIQLADFAGQIVVLDFFAYWCVPCRRATAEIETSIQKYYESKRGNPHQVPVRVVAVNIEPAHPEKTAEFVKQTGAKLVATDPDAALLAKLDGAGTPFIVIIDGTRGTRESPEFQIIYKRAGFEGTKKLREVIDAVEPAHTAEKKSARRGSDPEQATGPPRLHKGGIAFEALLASDVQLTTTSFNYGQQQGGTEWNLSYTHNTYGVDYEPYQLFDFLGFAERLDENQHAGQAAVRQKLGNSFTVLASGGGYDGFTDYRSLWLANYYRQQFNFVPGYQEPNPRGLSGSAGFRWEYQPTTGFAEAGFLYSYDEIAPGYELEPVVGVALHGRDTLHTYAPSLMFENVLTSRIRTLNEFQLRSTSGREARYTYRGSVNVALGERWVWRTSGGYAHEDPTLRAWHVGSTVEFEITPRWLINASGLYYHDTGEIENSLFISTAAPGLETWQGGLGIRYAGEHSSFHLAVAPVWSDYDPVEVGTRPFANLYRDRTWLSVQAAWSFEL